MSFLIFFAFPTQAQVNEVENLMVNLVAPTPIVRTELISLIFKIIQYLLSFLGVIAIVILAYGGFLWMTAKGDEEKVRKAKKVLINGLIGLVIILLAYAIVSFVMRKTEEFAQPGLVCTPGACCAPCYRCNVDGSACNVYDSNCSPCSGPSGQPFVVSWTYPKNGDENISLCALLQAGFNADLDENSVNSETVKITIRDGKNDGEDCNENKDCKSQKCVDNHCKGNTVAGTFTVFKNVFKFDNEVDFEKEIWYRFLITPGVRSKDGRNLASQRIIDFKTGRESDNLPPKVEQTYPESDQENVCLLDPIQVIFNEPMDVTTLLNEKNSYTDPSHSFNRWVPNVKTLILSPRNPYRENTSYQVTLIAGSLLPPRDGIADVCGNLLDGNKNGQEEGSPDDDYKWSFKTGNTLYCDPIIDSLNPNFGFYNDEITISGNYFKIAGELIFNQNVYVNGLCFDDDNFPKEPCLVSWQNKEIKVKVPAAGGFSEGAISGPVYVKIGGRQSNSKNFTLLSPYISSFTPTSGGRGQAITLKGERFGKYNSKESKVYFINETTRQRIEGNLICEDAGWKENEIVVAIPDDIALGNYYLQVKTSDGKYSNIRSQTFQVNDQEPGPILCDITPYCPGTNLRGGKKDDEKILSGDRFGPSRGKVFFNGIEAEISSWTNKNIKIKVPSLSSSTYQVKVQDSNGKYSNPLSFISPCLPRGGFSSACFLDPNTCTNERCLPPYQCLSGINGSLECRCCCTPTAGCPNNLNCATNQICYKNKRCSNLTNEADCLKERSCYWRDNKCQSIEIYGVCCGCDENGVPKNEKCRENEICKQKNSGPFCCYSCEIGDETKPCNGGQCCQEDCAKFKNQDECQRYEGCSWENNTCQGQYPICCAGRCVKISENPDRYECKTLCGNGRIDPNEECDPGASEEECKRFNNQQDCENYEGCQWQDNKCQPKINLGNKTCRDLGFESGELSCTGTCRFDTSGCYGRVSGRLGDVCYNEALGCYSGVKDCALAPGTACVRNDQTAPCACCCRADDPNTPDENEDTCQELELECDPTKNCNSISPPQKGLCCGCKDNDDKCCKNPPCIGTACYDNCCVRFGPPTDLKVVDPTTEKITLKWQFSDPQNLATEFEIWRKAPDEDNFSCYASCGIKKGQPTGGCFNLEILSDGKFCKKKEKNDNFSLTLEGNFYKFVDKTGNFLKEPYSFKVRAVKGTSTAYTEFTPPASGTPTGVISCQDNNDCPDATPCCRKDNKVCVDWQNCDNQCEIDNRCRPPEKKFALADFWITTGQIGPCLVKVNPNQGYPCEPDLEKNLISVVLEGKNFGSKGINDGVFFNGKEGSEFEDEKEACDGCDRAGCYYKLWQNEKIEIERTPPDLAQSGLVKVKKVTKAGEILWSNGKTFIVRKRSAGAGEACKKDIEGCPVGGICQPNNVYPCLECDCSQFNKDECERNSPYCQWIGSTCRNVICEEINNQNDCQKYSHCFWLKAKNRCLTQISHCRCCCDPFLRGPNDPCKTLDPNLECYPNQTPCTGNNRGLCCGCQKDSDCNLAGSNNYGCDLGKPRCCRPRPTWRSTSFCDDTGPNDVRLNTALTLEFSEEMDFDSINNESLKISREGSCTEINEGNTITIGNKKRCYLFGTITNDGNNKVEFRPRLCKLKTNTSYKIEIVVDTDGKGIRSKKGVSLDDPEGKSVFCFWDQTKKCLVQEFKTAQDPNTLCEIEWIDVQPRPLQIIRDLNVAVNYTGFARDKKNKSVCVDGFQWRSSNINVAVVSPQIGISTVATSKGLGEAFIIAEIPAINKACLQTPEDKRTCGKLKVSLAGPQVIEQENCDVCELGGQSPSPSKFSANACWNAQIVAKFNRVIDRNSLNSNNIIVVECQGNNFDEPLCPSEPSLQGEITLIPDPDNPTGFRFKPINPLIANKIYRVTLKSGKNGIKDKNGLQLDGNKNGIEDGSPADDYVWLFKTRDTPDCPLNKVCLYPQKAKINHPGNQTFNAEIYTANCNYLEPNDFSWDWSKGKINPWDPDKVASLTPSRSRAIASSIGLGEVYIKATTQGKSDQARLTVATAPEIIKEYPTGSGLCRNINIWALFNQKMDEKSFPGNFKIEKKSEKEWIDVTNNFSLRFTEEEEGGGGKTKVHFVPKYVLDENTTYRITLLGERNISGGVKSIPPFERAMIFDKSWQFETGKYICYLEKIKVKPAEYLFTKAKQTKDFEARTYYQNQEIQPLPGLYNWSWNWHSTDPTIVSITNSDNPQQTAQSQSKNGTVYLIAKATITQDSIFKPSTVGQSKEGQAKVEVWLCENPWPCTNFPNCSPYKDLTTNFEFKYCRDAGPAGLEGDLPILKGGEISGPTERGKLKEHFFSVYDGSLSFLYDGEEKLQQIQQGGQSPINSIPNKSGYNNPNYTIFGDNNAQIFGNVSLNNSGKFGKALSFDGNSYLRVNRNLTIEPENFTLEAWISPKKLIIPSGSIFKKGVKDDLTNTGQGYGLEIINSEVYFWLFDKEGNKAEIKGPQIPQVSWTHLAANYDGRNLKLYLNGVLQKETSSLKGGISHSESDLYIGQNFQGLIDDIAFYHKVLSQTEIEKHLKDPISPTLGDVIGFKVFSNFEHLKPEEWVKKYAPGEIGGVSHLIVDGYKAAQVGRTIYVGATNVDLTTSRIYTNLYLISQSDNPKPETSQLFKESINNWRFNINIENPRICNLSSTKSCLKDLDCPRDEFCNAPKDKLIRDLERIWDIRTIWQTLEEYPLRNTKEKDLYPRLETGTYIKGMSVSKWPSWSPFTGLGQDLTLAGLSPLPSDPINKFATKTCGSFPTTYNCCANCPRKDPQCSETCFNPENLTYEALPPSQVYQYMVEDQGRAYSLYLNFEYDLPDFWHHGCQNLKQSECQKRAFCYWEKTVPPGSYLPEKFRTAQVVEPVGECWTKILNYFGNPCSSPSTCQVFNARFSSKRERVPLSVDLTASPDLIYSGGQTTLTWSTSGVTNCQASANPLNDQWSGSVELNGSKTISGLTETTTFYLTCYSQDGQQLADSAEVRVQQPPPPPRQYTLSVTKAGNGQGTVTSNPSGINCGSICSSSFEENTQVTLTATPQSGSEFKEWSGACSGTSQSCTLIMNSDKSVTATFILPFNFSLSVSPSSGSVEAGRSISTDLTATLISGDPQPVSFSASPSISGVSYNFSPTSCSPTCSSTLTINTSSTTPPSAYTIVITASGGGISRTVNYNLTVNPPLPTVETLEAKNITSNEAVLNAQANPNGSNTIGWFRYSTVDPGNCNDNFGTRVPATGGISLGNGRSPVSYSQVAIDLLPGRTYYFCAIVQNANGQKVYGNIRSFTTFAYSGLAYVANHDNHNVLKIDINTLGVTTINLRTPPSSDDDPQAACISPNKRYVFITDDDYNDEDIFQIDTQTNQVVRSISTCRSPDFCAVTPDGQYLIVSCHTSNVVKKYQAENLNPVPPYNWSIPRPRDIAIDPYGKYIYVTVGPGSDYDLARINLENNTIIFRSFNPADGGDGIALSRDGRYLYLNVSERDEIIIVDTNTLSEVGRVAICDGPKWAIGVTPDNRYLLVGCPGSNSNNVCKYEISYLSPYLTLKNCTPYIDDARYDLAITNDKQYAIVSDSSSDKIHRININNMSISSITSYVNDPRGVCIK